MRAMVDVEVDDSNSKLMTNKSEIEKLWSTTQKSSVKRSKRVSLQIFDSLIKYYSNGNLNNFLF
jgi:hypothetical protein